MEEQHKHHIGRWIEVSVPCSGKEAISYEEWPVVSSIIDSTSSFSPGSNHHHATAIPHRLHEASAVAANATALLVFCGPLKKLS